MAVTDSTMVSDTELEEIDLHSSSVRSTRFSLDSEADSKLTLARPLISFIGSICFVCFAILATKQMHLHTDLDSLIHLGFGRLNNRLWASLRNLLPQAVVSSLTAFEVHMAQELKIPGN